jgi:RNA polymerase sigma factor (sigma-70 family)
MSIQAAPQALGQTPVSEFIQYSRRSAVYLTKRSEMSEASQTIADQDQLIALAMQREESRLRGYIRNHIADRSLTEDILQEVFVELIEAYRLMKPIEQVGAWMFRVARNRIVDLFRRRTTDSLSEEVYGQEDGESVPLESLLPSPDEGPEAAYVRAVLIDELEEALEELPEEQRAIFIAHELEGKSFKELAAETGVGVNTLLSRKRYAVLHLRERLQSIYQEFGMK